MQVLGATDPAYRSMCSAYQTVVRQEGYRGVFKGASPAICLSLFSYVAYLGFYEKIKQRKREAGQFSSMGAVR